MAIASASSLNGTGMDQRVTLISQEGQAVTTTRRACQASGFLKGLLEEMPDDEEIAPIGLETIDTATLQRAVVAMELHAAEPMATIERPLRTSMEKAVGPKFANMVTTLSDEDLIKLMTAANFLNSEFLLDLTCANLACLLTNKTVDEIRERWGLKDDLTPEEREKLKEMYGWAYQA